MSYVTVDQLLEAGAHFGHLTRRWNPQMRNFIYSERNGVHIIDLRKTQVLVEVAHDAAVEASSKGGKFLFVGTKKQAKNVLSEEAKRCGAYYITDRWLGGMLTNFATIRKSIKRLDTIEKMEADGTFEKVGKKERLTLSREREKLLRVFGGIREMSRMPSAIFIVDIRKEHIAILEARKLGIPVFGIVDTNCDPRNVDYPIPANDDSIQTIALISKVMADAAIEGRELNRMRSLDSSSGKDSAEEAEADSPENIRRRMRKRKPHEGGSEQNADVNVAEAQAIPTATA